MTHNEARARAERAAERAAWPDLCIQSLISPDTMDILFILSMIYSVIRIKRIYTTKQQHNPLQFGPDTPRHLTLAFEYLIGNRQTMQHAGPLGGVQSSQSRRNTGHPATPYPVLLVQRLTFGPCCQFDGHLV